MPSVIVITISIFITVVVLRPSHKSVSHWENETQSSLMKLSLSSLKSLFHRGIAAGPLFSGSQEHSRDVLWKTLSQLCGLYLSLHN